MNLRPVSVSHESVMAAPPDRVWSLVADPTRRPEWMTELTRVEAEPGPLSVGDRFTGESSILLHDFIGESEVKVADPDQALVEEVVIGARFTSRWSLRPDGTGTAVHHTIDVDFPAGPFSPLERWVLRRRLLQMQKASLRNLERVLATPG